MLSRNYQVLGIYTARWKLLSKTFNLELLGLEPLYSGSGCTDRADAERGSQSMGEISPVRLPKYEILALKQLSSTDCGSGGPSCTRLRWVELLYKVSSCELPYAYWLVATERLRCIANPCSRRRMGIRTQELFCIIAEITLEIAKKDLLLRTYCRYLILRA